MDKKEILSKKIIEEPEDFICQIVRSASEYDSFSDMNKILSEIHKKLKLNLNNVISMKIKDKNKELIELTENKNTHEARISHLQKEWKEFNSHLSIISEEKNKF